MLSFWSYKRTSGKKMKIENSTIYHAPNVLWHYRIPTYNELSKRCKSLEIKYVEVEKDLQNSPDSDWNNGAAGGFNTDSYSIFINIATIHALSSKCDCLLLEWNIRNLSLIPITVIARHLQRKRVIWWGHGSSKTPSVFTKISVFLGRILPNAVVVYSDTTKRELVSNSKYNAQNTFAAKNGIDVKQILNASHGIGDLRHQDTWITAYSGRLTKERDLCRIIHTIAEVKSKGISTKHYFIGDGEFKNDLEELAKKLGVASEVVFTGVLHDITDLAKIYAEVDFVIIPGWLGLVINQAFAFGKPVVICDNKELHNPEIALFDENKGWVYSHNTSNLTEVYMNITQLSKVDIGLMGSSCQKLIIDEYSTQTMVDGLQEAIEGVTPRVTK